MKADYPELRAAYAVEREALQRIADMKARRAVLAEQVDRLRRDHDHAAARMARGENVTGADIRRGIDAVQDSEAELAVLEAALPRAAIVAYEAASARSKAEQPAYEAAYQPFRAAAVAAEKALKAAQEAHEKAQVDVERMPTEARSGLNEILDSHGRDRTAPIVIAEMRRVQEVNEIRRKSGQGPEMAWP